jgi:hypothetical protein
MSRIKLLKKQAKQLECLNARIFTRNFELVGYDVPDNASGNEYAV